jgi:hypothetical protein
MSVVILIVSVWLLTATSLNYSAVLAGNASPDGSVTVQVPNLDQAGSQRPQLPCEQQPQFREFDFWIGEWDVTSDAKKIAESSIRKTIGSCVIFENYSDPSGFNGKSFNFYDSTLKKWRQTWVDNQGNVSEFSGEYKDGAMRFEGESHRRDGQRILRKMVVSKLGANRVRQYSENSVDGGKTWKTSYDFIYLRKKIGGA